MDRELSRGEPSDSASNSGEVPEAVVRFLKSSDLVEIKISFRPLVSLEQEKQAPKMTVEQLGSLESQQMKENFIRSCLENLRPPHDPSVRQALMDIEGDLKSGRIGTLEAIRRRITLFYGQRDKMRRFSLFLPSDLEASDYDKIKEAIETRLRSLHEASLETPAK